MMYMLIIFIIFIFILAWFSVKPSNRRDWSPDQILLPYADISDDDIVLHNVRNCEYSSEHVYKTCVEDLPVKLSGLTAVYFSVCPFPVAVPGGAHIFYTFEFDKNIHIGISVEVRKKKGQIYKFFSSLFRQYELMYVVAREEDLIKVRALHRTNEFVYTYPFNITLDEGRKFFLQMIKRANKLTVSPEFYHPFLNSCTTNPINDLNQALKKKLSWHYSFLMPEYTDKFFYNRGLLRTQLPFHEAKERFSMNERIKKHLAHPNISSKIREEDSRDTLG